MHDEAPQAGGPVTVAAQLRDAMPELTPSERKVARALLAAYPVAGLGTLAELARHADVSGPTVLRLLTRLGFAGFTDFQRRLLMEIDERSATAAEHFDPERGGTAESLVRMTLLTVTADLAADVESITETEVRDVVEALAEARRVFLIGGALSHAAAYYLYLQLDMLRPGCRFLGAAGAPAWNALLELGRRDVLVVFDYRRYEPVTLEITRYAAAKSVRVVLFTDRWLSPVAGEAGHLLVSRTASPSAFDTLVPAIAYAETIAAALAVRLGSKVQRRIAAGEAVQRGRSWERPDGGDTSPPS